MLPFSMEEYDAALNRRVQSNIEKMRMPDASGVTAGDYSRALARGLDRLGLLIGQGMEATGLERAGGAVSGLYRRRMDEQTAGMTPAFQREMEKPMVEEVAPSEGIFGYKPGPGLTSIPKILGTSVESLPATAAGMALGGVGGSALRVAGASPAVAGAIGYGAGEAAISAGMNAGDIYDTIRAMPEDVLAKSEEFQSLYANQPEGTAHEQRVSFARDTLASSAAKSGAIPTAITTFLLSAPAGAVFGRMLGGLGPKSAAGRVAQGIAAESSQEFAQSGPEQYWQNLALRRANPEQSLSKGVLEQAVGGAVGGAVLGGGGAMLAGRPQTPQIVPPVDEIQPEEAPLPLTDIVQRGPQVAPQAEEIVAPEPDIQQRQTFDAIDLAQMKTPALRRLARERGMGAEVSKMDKGALVAAIVQAREAPGPAAAEQPTPEVAPEIAPEVAITPEVAPEVAPEPPLDIPPAEPMPIEGIREEESTPAETPAGIIPLEVRKEEARKTAIAPEEKINGITREEAGKLMAAGDPTVLEHIVEGVKHHGGAQVQDAIRNEALKVVAETPRGPERDKVRANIAKIEPEVNAALRGEVEAPAPATAESPWAYHKTTGKALEAIRVEGMTAGDFIEGHAIDFPGDVTLRVRVRDLPSPQIGEYGKGEKWYLPNYEDTGAVIPPSKIEMKQGRKWVSLSAPSLPAKPMGPGATVAQGGAEGKTSIPAGVNVQKSGKPFTERGLRLVLNRETKKGRAVEAVQLSEKEWGWREIEDVAPKDEVWSLPITDALREAVQGGQPMYSRAAESPAPGLSVEDVKSVAEPLARLAVNAAPTVVVQNAEKMPKAARAAYQRETTKGGGRIRAFLHGGTTYLIADEITSKADALEGWMHEQAGHHGTRALFPNERQWRNVMDATFNGMPRAERNRLRELYGIQKSDLNSRLILADEYMASIAEKVNIGEALAPREQTLWQKFIDAVRRAWRRITRSGQVPELSEKQVAAIVKDAARKVLTGKAAGEAAQIYRETFKEPVAVGKAGAEDDGRAQRVWHIPTEQKPGRIKAKSDEGIESFWQDNPGGIWLEEERAGKRKGAITAGFRMVNFPVDYLLSIPGERGEQARIKPGDKTVAEIAESIRKKGFDKTEPVFVIVEKNGWAVISEGNHRARAAKEAGMSTVPTEIRYAGGGEIEIGLMSPKIVEKLLRAQEPDLFSRVDDSRASRVLSSKPVTFDAETEARYQAAKKGLADQRKITARINAAVRHAISRFRYLPDLPKTAEFAEARETIRQFEAAPTVAKEQAIRALDGIAGKLNPAEYDLFTRKVILDDLAFEVEQEHALPFGFTPETVARDKANIDRAISESPAVKESLRKRQSILDAVKRDLLNAGIMEEEQFKNPAYFRHQVITYAAERLAAQGARSIRKPRPGYAMKRGGSMEDISANYLEAEFEYMHRALIDIRTSHAIERIAKKYDKRAELTAKADKWNAAHTGDKKRTWKDFIPDGYSLWSPEKGNVFYTGRPEAERIMAEFMERVQAEGGVPGVTQDEIAAVMERIGEAEAKRGRMFSLVLPDDLSTTLGAMAKANTRGWLDNLFRTPLSYWKRWVLINPRRVLKYNLNNLSGDLDAVIAGNPRTIRRLPQAIRELYAVLKGGQPSARYKEALERGVFDTGLTVQEIPEINKLDKFSNLRGKLSAKDMPAEVARKIWRTLKDYTQFRENWMRYAAYLDYVERLESGESMKSIGYGAAYAPLVDGLTDNKDKAGLLSRELVGDYGAISEAGREIRAKLIPFYSWVEINTRRYLRIFANAYSQGVGEGLKTTGTVGAIKGARLTAWLAMRTAILYGLVQLWNNLFFPDEEDELDAQARTQLHLTLGRDKDGKVSTLRFQGALSDFLQWFGFEDAAGMIGEIQKGRASFGDLAGIIAKAPVNKIVGGVTPLIRTPVEMAAKRSFWPDVFHPRVIPDRMRELTRLVSMENEYDWITDAPSRGYWHSVKNALVYERDPGETAYNNIQEKKRDYMRNVLGREGSGDYTSPRSEALRDLRKALRYGDEKAEKKARDKLKELRVRSQDITQSIRTQNPLHGLNVQDKAKFRKTLTEDEKKQLEQAMKWYREVFLTDAKPVKK